MPYSTQVLSLSMQFLCSHAPLCLQEQQKGSTGILAEKRTGFASRREGSLISLISTACYRPPGMWAHSERAIPDMRAALSATALGITAVSHHTHYNPWEFLKPHGAYQCFVQSAFISHLLLLNLINSNEPSTSLYTAPLVHPAWAASAKGCAKRRAHES